MREARKRYTGSFMSYKSSFDGAALFDVSLYRETRIGTSEAMRIEVVIDRSSIRCIYHALQKFAEAEREAVKELPL